MGKKMITDDAKRLLKKCLGGLLPLKYIHVEREYIVSTDSTALVAIMRHVGACELKEGAYTKDFDKVDTDKDYTYPNWKGIMPFDVDRNDGVVFTKREDIVRFLYDNNKQISIDHSALLLRESECNLFLYESLLVAYYESERMFMLLMTKNVDSDVGVRSNLGTIQSICDEIFGKDEIQQEMELD